MAGSQTITVSANTLTLGGSLSTAELQNITKAGGGTLVLGGAVTIPSPTYAPSITGGTLQIIADQALAADQTITVGSGGTLSLGGVISGVGFGVKKDGAGTLVLSNAASTYTGVTTLDAGVLNVGTFANGGASSSLGAATNAASNLVLNGGTLQYTGGAAATTDRLFTLGAGTVTLDSSSANTANYLQFTNAGAIGLAGSGTRNLVLTGSYYGTVNNSEWNGTNNNIASIIGDGTGGVTSLTKTGTGRWVLSGANTYTGGTTVSNGQLAIRSGTALGTGNVDVAAGHAIGLLQRGHDGRQQYHAQRLVHRKRRRGRVGRRQPRGWRRQHVERHTDSRLPLSNVSTSWSDKSLNITGKVTGPGGLQIDR